MCNWIPMLYSINWHNTLNQLHSNIRMERSYLKIKIKASVWFSRFSFAIPHLPTPPAPDLANGNGSDGSCSISLSSGGRLMRSRVMGSVCGKGKTWRVYRTYYLKLLRFWTCFCIITQIYFYWCESVVYLLCAKNAAKLKGIHIFH